MKFKVNISRKCFLQRVLPGGTYFIQTAGGAFLAFDEQSRVFSLNNQSGDKFNVIYDEDTLILRCRGLYLGQGTFDHSSNAIGERYATRVIEELKSKFFVADFQQTAVGSVEATLFDKSELLSKNHLCLIGGYLKFGSSATKLHFRRSM